MTPEAFHALAMQLDAVRAKPVMQTVRFQVANLTFATLGWPAQGWAVLKLPLVDQRRVVKMSSAFVPESGRRGAAGVTLIRLEALQESQAEDVLAAAWRLAQTGERPSRRVAEHRAAN